MNNNKNIIIDYLQLTTEQYNEIVFQNYWNWCLKYGKTPAHTQQLLACSTVNKWWMNEYSKLEVQFINAIGVLPLRKDILEHTFYAFTVQIFANYPKPLIDAIRNDNLKNEVETIKKYPSYYAN
jgi:hypothetical protein